MTNEKKAREIANDDTLYGEDSDITLRQMNAILLHLKWQNGKMNRQI